MSLTGVYLPDESCSDLHLLPGLVSPRLDHLFAIEDSTGNTFAHTPPAGVAVTFAAAFAGAPAKNHGISIAVATGEITVDSPLPPGPRLRSFLVTCTATQGAVTRSERVRIHVHDHVTELWLTPARLTVREGAKNMRLSLLAHFDDGVIGDISNWAPVRSGPAGVHTFVRRAGVTVPHLTWSTSDPGIVDVDPATGGLVAKAVVGSATITASHPPLPPPPSAFAQAAVVRAPSWSTPVRLDHVAGPGFAGMATARNILFLPDGFQDTPADRAAFDRITRDVAGWLGGRAKTRPFDLLKHRLNYFAAWVPSPDAGVSVLNEINRTSKSGAPTDGLAVPVPAAPPAAGTWSLEHLVDRVGLPVPAHDPDGSPLGSAAAGRLHDWNVLYPPPAITAALMGHLYAGWLDLNGRVLLNERDTAFHMAIGYRPRMGRQTDRDLTRHVRRLDDADLDIFLDALQDTGGGAIPNVWSRGGRDDDLLVVLCRSNRHAGANAERLGGGHLLAISLLNDKRHRLRVATTVPGFEVRPDPVPPRTHPDTWTKVAHELAHSWMLGDEYGGPKSAAAVGDLLGYGNVQLRAGLLDGAGNLVTAALKWRWPRLQHAGVLVSAPAPVGTRFRLRLEPGHAAPFVAGPSPLDPDNAVGDIVRLRTRPLVPSAAQSDRFHVVGKAGDEIEIEPLPGSVLAATFPPGSILMTPIRAPQVASGVLGEDLGLVAASILARIDATHAPLNAAADAGATPTYPTNFAGAPPNPPTYSAWIVGLYDQGANADAGVYRPTGVCLMRQQLFGGRAYQFCPVCRYVLIDLIDPSKHAVIETDFAPRYPS